MKKLHRHEQMLVDLAKVGAIRIVEQAYLYGVTPETIRRDIETLSNEGKLVRTYGGAILSSIADEPSANARTKLHTTERKIIAIEAAKLVKHMSVIMVDGGSTTSFFANQLAMRYFNQTGFALTVITNSYDVARALAESAAIRIIMCPGDFDARENAVFGARTNEFLRGYSASAAVFSAGGVSEEGVMDVNSDAAWVKRAMIKQADRSILMVNDAKIGVRQLERVGGLSIIDQLVCNSPPPKRFGKALKADGVSVRVAQN